MKRDGGYENRTLVIRLSDGYAWHLRDGPDVVWGGGRTAIALTCDELVALVWEKISPTGEGRFNVARVRLDSLGPPTPP
jgi:hypothetical protein